MFAVVWIGAAGAACAEDSTEATAAGVGVGFSVFRPASGPGVQGGLVRGSVLRGPLGALRVAAGRPGKPELWLLGDDGAVADVGHPGWSHDGKVLRVEWEKGEPEETNVAGYWAFPWAVTGGRHDAYRLSDWLVARKEAVALPFLGGKNVGLRFEPGGAARARAVGGEPVEGSWWWSRGLLHVRLDGFEDVATYEWRPLARHVGWNSAMSAPVAAEAVAPAPSRPGSASPPPRSLPGAAAVCKRDVLGALLRTATESSDVVSALGIEKETIILCRDRQKLVVEVIEAERRLSELIEKDAKKEVPAAAEPSVVRTVAQLVAARPREADELPKAVDVGGAGRKAAPGGAAGDRIAAERAPPQKAVWSWFSMLGRKGRLVAGVTDGSGAWFVGEGERVPGAGVVKRISARPPVVEVAGVGMLAWVEAPPAPGAENDVGAPRSPPAAPPRRVADETADRVVERVFGRTAGAGPGGGTLRGRADAVDGDSLRMGEVRIRLWGIDAPERDQLCRAEGREWGCGLLAMAALRSRATDISCREKGRDGYGRVLAVCFDDGADVNAWLVAEGWALAYRRFAMDYVDEEEAARQARKGMHRGEFIEPWHWRRGERFGRAEAGGARSGGAAGAAGETRARRLPPLPGRETGR